MSFSSVIGSLSTGKALIAVLGVLILMIVDVRDKLKHRNHHIMLAAGIGTALSLGIVKFGQVLLHPDGLATAANGWFGYWLTGVLGMNVALLENATTIALGVVLLIALWRLLFGTWESTMKATVLGTCTLWLGLAVLWSDVPADRLARVLTIVVALIPALVWASLFLKYHRERIGTVLLMFFAGILSTAPILFYDALSRKGIELNFFLFRLVPERFSESVDTFVRSGFPDVMGTGRIMLTLLLNFIVVALLEEFSKYWVLKRAGQRIFTSIDDVIQMAIIVAIGFSVAENVLNQGYFLGFVQDYLASRVVSWSGFIGNVAGRSVLTSMVHIVSTGITGYYLGLALYAEPYCAELESKGRAPILSTLAHRWFRMPRLAVFRTQMVVWGLTLATILHATANFLVSLPDALPGNPRTLGELFGAPAGSPLYAIALLLIPSLLYVGGGFWLLSSLFLRKENRRERGRIIAVDTFVSRKVFE